MSTLERAIEIAAQSHAGQLDKADQPYILHPLRVMLAVNSLHERIVAVLHDVIEDTKVTYEVLKGEGFPEEVIDAVRALTKLDGESRMEAAQRTIRNPIARAVKIADIRDNMNVNRIPSPTKKDFDRMKEYEQVLIFLLPGKESW